MTLEWFWTDICFLTLLLLGLIITLASLKKKHIRTSFALMLKKPLAVCSGIVLYAFLVIGVLDSIHFNTSKNQMENAESILDKILAPLGSSYEKTYSAPLALNLFVTETVLKKGIPEQVYPRLTYLPESITTEQEKTKVIKNVVLRSILWSTLMTSACWMLLVLSQLTGAIREEHSTFRGLILKSLFKINAARFSALTTIAVLVFFFLLSYWLSRTFHVLGTGQIGQDIFYFTVKSIRTGLVIGLLTTLFMLPLALFLGIAAGYYGGIIDDIIQYLYTTLSSIPGVLLITASVLSLQTYIASHPKQFTTLAQSADARLLALCFILGVTSWTSLCRLLRAEALKLREVDYVKAGIALGSSWFTLLRKHLLPNVMHIVIITVVLDFSFLVMAEAVLSYVGVGVSPMTISWGNMINGARLELAREPLVWWPIFAAFLFMFLLVLAINLFADGLKDSFDPQR